MISIKDMAKQLGVSPSTISRVVNGKKYVNPEKRRQILDLIKETGYVPNKAARSMVLQRSFTVGIVIPDTFNMFQRQLFSIIERYLESFGYHTLVFFVKFEGSSEEIFFNRLKSEHLDGIIMIHEVKHPGFFEYVRDSRIPLVSATFDCEGIPSIHVQEEAAAMEAVNHLLKLGHTSIDMISGTSPTFAIQRINGYYRALEYAGLPREPHRVVMVPSYTPESGESAMRELLLRDSNFTAVFAATDELAIGAIRALQDEGIRVPDDVSVVGFDDIDISSYYIPRLTTIRQPIQEIGERTALTLHHLISSPDAREADAVLGYKLIVRESTRGR